MRRDARTLTLALLAVGLALAAGSARAARDGSPAPPSWVLAGPYSPRIDPANFVRRIDNTYFPLLPGTAFRYRGVRDGTPQTDDMVVTRRTKNVLGVRCTVVEDTVSSRGKPVERTFDWYAQDKQGNVWYMGEDSFELRNGRFVLASDSWKAGARGAKPGIIMRAHPRAGAVYRQEYYRLGGALDQGRVLGGSARVTVPAGSFRHVLATVEWSPVEPQLEKKWYVAGVGEVKEKVVAGGHEQFELVRVTH